MKYLLIPFFAAGILVACSPKTTEIVEVEQATEETASSSEGDMPKADIGEGKVIFLEDCITCHSYTSGPHSVEDLDNFSKEQISAVLPKMIENAELTDEQARQIRAYIFWELEN